MIANEGWEFDKRTPLIEKELQILESEAPCNSKLGLVSRKQDESIRTGPESVVTNGAALPRERKMELTSPGNCDINGHVHLNDTQSSGFHPSISVLSWRHEKIEPHRNNMGILILVITLPQATHQLYQISTRRTYDPSTISDAQKSSAGFSNNIKMLNVGENKIGYGREKTYLGCSKPLTAAG
ncbi:hypothetical protein TNCV_1908861 [Trichonephila clavipes]|nr:hypothetical protein TNCV_1908861 [Trichonephila clavipes]